MKKVILVSVALIFFLLGCVSQSSDQSNVPVSTPPLIQQKVETTETGATKTTDTNPIFETVTIKDENGTFKITKNLIIKTAEVEYRVYTGKNEYGDDTVFGTLFMCGILQQIFFDPIKFDEWIKGWDQGVDGNVVVDSNETNTANIVNNYFGLLGYRVTNLSISSIDQDTEQQVGLCTVSGKEENQLQITFYGKYVAEYEEYKKNNQSDENNTN